MLLKMKLVCRAKKSWFPAPPKARTRFAAKARKGTPGGGGTMPTPEGPFPTVIGNPGPVSTVLLAVNPQYKVIAPSSRDRRPPQRRTPGYVYFYP